MGTTFANFSCDGNVPCSNEQLTISERVSLKVVMEDAIFNAETLVSDVDLFFSDITWLLISAELVGRRKILFVTRFERWSEKFVFLPSFLCKSLFNLSAMVVKYSLKVSVIDCELSEVLESDFKFILPRFLVFRFVS